MADKLKILNMQAGKEMDALIAKHAMKARHWENGAASDYDGEYPMYSDWDDGAFWYEDADGGYLWTPSQNLADTWEVVEKLRAKPTEFAFEITTIPVMFKGYRVSIGAYHSVIAETLPLAICRAALLATLE